MSHKKPKTHLINLIVNFILNCKEDDYVTLTSQFSKCLLCESKEGLVAFYTVPVATWLFPNSTVVFRESIIWKINNVLTCLVCSKCLCCLQILPSPEKIKKLKRVLNTEIPAQ